jgi:hypothetical protein
MTFLSLDFLRCDKFRFAFFALVEVHHVTIKRTTLTYKNLFSRHSHAKKPDTNAISINTK